MTAVARRNHPERLRDLARRRRSNPRRTRERVLWGRDLSGYYPDGPLPAVDPGVDNVSITRGRVRHAMDPRAVAQEWRDLAAARGGLSIREVVIEMTGRQAFVGSARTVAAEIDRYVQGDACDGFILVPYLTPGGLDEFVDTVIPELQDRDSFRTSYSGPTLRDHLNLPVGA